MSSARQEDTTIVGLSSSSSSSSSPTIRNKHRAIIASAAAHQSSRRTSDGASALMYQASMAVRLSSRRSLKSEGEKTYITSLIDDLRSALQQLMGDASSVSLEELEGWAVFIHTSVSAESRGYHNIERLFDITAGADAFQLLCGFFRDTIHYFVDGGLNRKQLELLEGVMDDFVLLPHTQDEPSLRLITTLFGLEPGQDLREFMGLDAFLAAVVFSRVVRQTLTLSQLARITVCMEATIPFRPANPHDDGGTITAMDVLHARLCHANETMQLELSEEELVKSIQRAADWSNRSIGNFASDHAQVFLDHTWSLLPEQSAALRRSCLFTVQDYQMAISNMVDFLSQLDASQVFTCFRGVPSDAEMSMFRDRTRRNIDLGLRYMRAELLSVSMVASFAILTGGDDGPMSMFVGDVPCAATDHQSDRLGEDFVVFDDENHHDAMMMMMKGERRDDEYQVYELLRQGRRCFLANDASSLSPRRDSPLAAFVYASLGQKGVSEALERRHHPLCPMTPSCAQELLSSLPFSLVETVGCGIAKIAVSRTEGIEQLLKDLSS